MADWFAWIADLWASTERLLNDWSPLIVAFGLAWWAGRASDRERQQAAMQGEVVAHMPAIRSLLVNIQILLIGVIVFLALIVMRSNL